MISYLTHTFYPKSLMSFMLIISNLSNQSQNATLGLSSQPIVAEEEEFILSKT